MKDYLNSVLRTCERTRDICADILEEVNDGSTRSALVVSSMEAVYALQSLVRAYMHRYPEYFDNNRRLNIRSRKFLVWSPEHWLKVKMHSRCFQNESNDVKYLDELPF